MRAILDRSIIPREHDRQHAGRLLRVFRSFRTKLHVLVVIVDLPDVFLAVDFDGSEVVLAVGVIPVACFDFRF